MRQRPREINIFNMSLIDILCGALGAFCFMMLVLLPYYKPPGEEADLQKTQKELSETLQELEKLKERMKDAEWAEEMQRLMEQLQSQVRELQGQVNRLATENQQLRGDQQRLTQRNEQLSTENKKLDEEARSLRMRRPFIVLVQTETPGHAIDLYVYDDLATSQGKKNPAFDPAKQRHTPFWPGDLNAYAGAHGVTTWMVRDSPLGTNFKIYVKSANPQPLQGPIVTNGIIVNQGSGSILLPNLTLTPERPWNLYGTLTVLADNKLAYQEATAEQRDAEWKAIMKDAPLPTPGPPPSRAGAMSLEERKALIERLKQEREARRGTPAPAPATPAPQR